MFIISFCDLDIALGLIAFSILQLIVQLYKKVKNVMNTFVRIEKPTIVLKTKAYLNKGF